MIRCQKRSDTSLHSHCDQDAFLNPNADTNIKIDDALFMPMESEMLSTSACPTDIISFINISRDCSATHHSESQQGIHNGEKFHKCYTCSQCFKGKTVFKRHQRIHTGEKPYQCYTCDKRVTRTNCLDIHQRIHTGEKPYTCPTCDKSFI